MPRTRRVTDGSDGTPIRAYDIEVHGVDHPQYFLGAGLAFTEYTGKATGCGEDAVEAYEDAVEALACTGYDVTYLPRRPRGLSRRDSGEANLKAQGEDRAEDCELTYYVTVRVR
jgi:hypothetical protein